MTNYTDSELITMTKQYTQDLQGNYIAHLAYEEINRQVENGRNWSKCPNCGEPYPLDQEGASMDFCSEGCYIAYVNYLSAEQYEQ